MVSSDNMNGSVLRLAIPSIVSNITVPLLGLVDVAVVGHLGSASYIGAIAVGGMLFNMIYWLFGFLRMGTSGMTSQALGRRDLEEVSRILYRSLGVSAIVAIALVILQYPIREIAFTFIDATGEVEDLAAAYFNICIWGAPAVLGLYGLNGWFIGMQNSRAPMFVAIAQNILNIAASLVLVFVFDMKVEGVALGTLVAQYGGFLIALSFWLFLYRERLPKRFPWRQVTDHVALRGFFKVNADIFLRTACLVAVTVFFTSTGARQGDIVLAVNTLLMQLFTLFSYFMDGFAYAGEALAGKFIGAGNDGSLNRMIRRLFKWGLGLALAFTLLYAIGGEAFLSLLTDDTTVIMKADEYFPWAVAVPFAGFAAFLWDGILVGATATRMMLRSMALASLAFFTIYYSLQGVLGNHALWLAFLTYLALRGVFQWLFWHRRGRA